jgi:ATP-dependent DNA helicase
LIYVIGKTVQVIAFFCALLDRFSVSGPYLVVMPLSVISSWKNDLERFSPHCDVYIHHGDKSLRLNNLQNWMKQIQINRKKDKSFSIILTTYDIIIKDIFEFLRINRKGCIFEYIVVDEAHRLKNSSSKLFTTLNQLKCNRRLLLTGTPLQNNLTELWSLLNFILPSIFHSVDEFSDWFNKPFEVNEDNIGNVLSKNKNKGKNKRKRNVITKDLSSMLTDEEKSAIVKSLHRVMKPFLLRRIKSDVILDLPIKVIFT